MGEIVQLRPIARTLVIDLDERRIVRLRLEPALNAAERSLVRYFATAESAREAAQRYARMAPSLYAAIDDRLPGEAC